MQKRRSQNEAIQKLCGNRKVQNFEYLKEWDLNRANKLMIHRKLIDELDSSIQQKLVESNIYIDVVRQFLTDLLTQKIKYQLQTVNNPETKIKNNIAGQIMHKHAGKALGKLYNLTNNYKGYKKLKNILEVGLQKVQKLLNESNLLLMQMKTKIQLKIVQIQNSNITALQLCNNLVTIFSKDKNTKPFLTQNDIYKQEQHFIYEAYIQTHLQRQLGQFMVNYIDYIEQLQKKKLGLMKEVIGSYLQGIQEQNNDTEQLTSLKDILKKQTEHKYINECYSIDQLISKNLITELSRVQNRHLKEINMKYVKKYLRKLTFDYFEFINYLILKEYHIFMKFKQQFQEIKVLITVDAFVNIYIKRKQLQISDNSLQNLYQEIDFSLKIDVYLNTIKEGDLTLILQTKKIKKVPNYNDVNKIQMIFSNEDQRQEFIEFIEKIMK